jgi:hypothetical protein
VRPDAPHVERFRLVTEGPPGGLPLWTSFPSAAPPRGTIPYKLFEIVEGAVLEVSAAPGDVVRAALELATPIGRRLRFVAAARADGDGAARLRVPYPTEPNGAMAAAEGPARVHATGPYRVEVGGISHVISVGEEDVRSGAAIRVGAGATGRDEPPRAGYR